MTLEYRTFTQRENLKIRFVDCVKQPGFRWNSGKVQMTEHSLGIILKHKTMSLYNTVNPTLEPECSLMGPVMISK